MRCSERGRLGSQPVKALMPGQSPYHELGAKLCGGAYQPDEYSHYSHATPEGEFPARQYRNLLLAPYIEFVDAVRKTISGLATRSRCRHRAGLFIV
jgi:hypothetical protein